MKFNNIYIMLCIAKYYKFLREMRDWEKMLVSYNNDTYSTGLIATTFKYYYKSIGKMLTTKLNVKWYEMYFTNGEKQIAEKYQKTIQLRNWSGKSKSK